MYRHTTAAAVVSGARAAVLTIGAVAMTPEQISTWTHYAPDLVTGAFGADLTARTFAAGLAYLVLVVAAVRAIRSAGRPSSAAAAVLYVPAELEPFDSLR